MVDRDGSGGRLDGELGAFFRGDGLAGGLSSSASLGDARSTTSLGVANVGEGGIRKVTKIDICK